MALESWYLVDIKCVYGFARVRLEAFSDNSGKLQLSLQEIIEWLTAKDEELSEQLPIGGDVATVQHQRDFHQVGSHINTCKQKIYTNIYTFPSNQFTFFQLAMIFFA